MSEPFPQTSPFKAGYRLGDYKLLWGEHSKGRWYDWRTGRKFKLDWERIQTKLTGDHNLVRFTSNITKLYFRRWCRSTNLCDDLG